MDASFDYSVRTIDVKGKFVQACPTTKFVVHTYIEDLCKANPFTCGLLLGGSHKSTTYAVETAQLWKTNDPKLTGEEITNRLIEQLRVLFRHGTPGLFPVGLFLSSETDVSADLDVTRIITTYHDLISELFNPLTTPIPSFITLFRYNVPDISYQTYSMVTDTPIRTDLAPEIRYFFKELVPYSTLVPVYIPTDYATLSFADFYTSIISHTLFHKAKKVTISHFMAAPRPGIAMWFPDQPILTEKSTPKHTYPYLMELRSYSHQSSSIRDAFFCLQQNLLTQCYTIYTLLHSGGCTLQDLHALEHVWVPLTHVESICLNAFLLPKIESLHTPATNTTSDSSDSTTLVSQDTILALANVYPKESDLDASMTRYMGGSAGTVHDKGLIVPKSKFNVYTCDIALVSEMYSKWMYHHKCRNNDLVKSAYKREKGHWLLKKAFSDPNKAMLFASIMGLIVSWLINNYIVIEGPEE